ncbi:MAG: 6-pyruvoyl trahydropterin synthase family protein [Bacteroidales bacterium]
MYIISKEFHFSAGHHLNGLPENHPCSRKHGHNYTVIIELRSPKLDGRGFVQDYNDLKGIKEFIDDIFDHRYLNDLSLPLLEQPTAENIAKTLFDIFKPHYPLLNAITVKETDKTSARYEPGYDE